MSAAKKISYYGIFTALAVVLGFAERLIPQPIAVPGVKLGLANIMVLIALYRFDGRTAFGVSVLRIAVTGLLFGGMSAALYSFAGGVFSFTAMYSSKRTNIFGCIGVSVLGGVAHNLGQIAIACLAVENIKLLYYTPVLIFSGILTGIFTGTAAYYTALSSFNYSGIS